MEAEKLARAAAERTYNNERVKNAEITGRIEERKVVFEKQESELFKLRESYGQLECKRGEEEATFKVQKEALESRTNQIKSDIEENRKKNLLEFETLAALPSCRFPLE